MKRRPDSLALKMRRFVDEGWVNLVGAAAGPRPPISARWPGWWQGSRRAVLRSAWPPR